MRFSPRPCLLCAVSLALWNACSSPEDPQTAAWQQEYSAGEKALDQGQYPLAQQRFEAARQALQTQADPRLIPTLQQLAHLHALQGRDALAESLYTHILDLQRQTLGPRDPQLLLTLGRLADLHALQGRDALAESLYTHILDLQRQTLDPHDPQLAATLGRLADLYRARHQYAWADSLDRRALAHKLCAQAYEYYLQGRYSQAQTFYRRALALQEKLGDHPGLARTCSDLGLVCQVQGQLDQAETFYRRALALQEKSPGDRPDLARTLDNFAALLRKSKREAEAQAAEARARQLRQAQTIP